MEILFVHDLIPWPKPLKKTRSRVIALKNQGCFHSEIRIRRLTPPKSSRPLIHLGFKQP